MVTGTVEVLVTANEAYPRLESLFLAARSDIRMGFRLFDPTTRLHSDAGLAVGKVWADLIVDTLNRGVSVELTLSDFDPIMSSDMHMQAWHFVARYLALNELTRAGAARIAVRALLHPAHGGIVPRLMFALRTRKDLTKVVEGLNDDGDATSALRFAPGLHELVRLEDGVARVRRFVVPRLHPVTLHHKLAVFDGQTTYIGGLDLNNRRYDDNDHDEPAQDTWHDIQLVLQDPDVARDALAFLGAMGAVISGRQKPPTRGPAFAITQSRRRRFPMFHLGPKPLVSDLSDVHIALIGAARKFIYMENQYFRDKHIAAALVAAGRRQPDLTLIVLLPAAPEDAAFDDNPDLDVRFGEHLQVRAIADVHDAFGDRFLVVSPVQPRPPGPADDDSERATLDAAPIVYVHAKVSLFDDVAAIVGSANLNGRSLHWDSEAGVVLRDPGQVTQLRQAVFRHWLTDSAGAQFYAPDTAFAAWRQRALDNRDRPPEQRQGFILPYDLHPAAEIGQPLPGAPEEMV